MAFVRIITLYADEKVRTVEELSRMYGNRTLLKERIRKVGSGILDNEVVIRGKKILLKPNWVLHNRKEEHGLCMRTNDTFILATVEVLLEKHPASITLCDAPVQSCQWEKILSSQFCKTIAELSANYSIPIAIKDLRRVTFDTTQNSLTNERNPLSEYIIFDVGKDSYLEPICSIKNRFRVTDYNPDRLAESHAPGKHKYCISKELFNADLIISMPKIKTHQKTGITGALKNIVGLNGDKDYLPHHRVGGNGIGGDCYPGKNILRRASEYALDNANRNRGKTIYRFWSWTAAILWKSSNPQNVHHLSAGWYGNDTCWRMVMDLNTILIYGKRDGTISKEPQRMLYSLCDGIIAGQGDGPLNPEPLALGVVCFTNNSSMADICIATLMGFDFHRIPLLQTAFLNVQEKEIDLTLNKEKINLLDLSRYSIPTAPPPGWINYLSRQ